MELGIKPTDRRRKRNIQVVFMVFMGLLLFLHCSVTRYKL